MMKKTFIMLTMMLVFLAGCGDDSSNNANLKNDKMPTSSTIDLLSSSSEGLKLVCDSAGTCFKSPLEICSKRPYGSECIKSCNATYKCEKEYGCPLDWLIDGVYSEICVRACIDYKDSLVDGNLYCFDLLRNKGGLGAGGLASELEDSLSNICFSSSNYCSYNWKTESCTNENCMKDSRDGQIYKITTVGKQTWMAQNLNYRGYAFPTAGRDSLSYCYNDSCLKYGRYYTWSAAMDSAAIFSTGGKNCGYFSYDTICVPKYPVQGICPYGWHLPTMDEWQLLVTTVGGEYAAAQILGATSGWGLRGNERNTNSVDFDIFPTGYAKFVGNSIIFEDLADERRIGGGAEYWSSSYGKPSTYNGVSDHKIFNARGFRYGLNRVSLKDGGGSMSSSALTVRCVKD